MATVHEVSRQFYDAWRAMSIIQRIIAEPDRAFSTSLRAMLVLLNQRQCSQKKLARTIGLKASGCSTLVNQLVEQGLVARNANPQDRREVLLALTPKGQDFCEEEMARRYSGFDETFSSLDQKDLDQLFSACVIIQEIQRKLPLEVDE